MAARLYAERLTRFLDWIDRFFGDAGMTDRTLFPHAFGLRTAAPLWTAPAFDRCLLLALLYPLATIYVIWAVSGHLGPAERALGLGSDLPGWERYFKVAQIGLCIFAVRRWFYSKGWKSSVWMLIAMVAGAVGAGGLFAFIAAVAIVGGVVFGETIAGALAVSISVALSMMYEFIPWAIFISFGFGGLVLGAADRARARQHLGIFLIILTAAMIILCFGAARWRGPALLFPALFALLNAPFDWASLGLTRALLRRGLELGGWWPYGLALVDGCLAAVIIAALALTMVVGVQAFDAFVVHGGGEAVICNSSNLI